MNCYLTKPIKIALGQDVMSCKDLIGKSLGVDPRDIVDFSLHKQSVDARNKSDVHFVCSYTVNTRRYVKGATPYRLPDDVLNTARSVVSKRSCTVVGAGPAGLFCALYLLKSGFAVTVVERGSDIERRSAVVKTYFDGGDFDVGTNVQFGLGGAGTFSDGKLTTGISSPLTYTVFNKFVQCGAPRQIITDSLPHIGTDKLTRVVAALRDEIIACGGSFLFDAKVADFVVRDGAVKGVVLQGEASGTLYSDCVVLACGHSARDIFAVLRNRGAHIEFKPFAVGVRIEHTRKFIDTAQYGALFATHRDLPSASYKLVYNGAEHSCYSFCMCPGGTVVAANSDLNEVVVNGMSNYLRNAANSNSALVVNVTARDVCRYGFGDGCFAGVEFQRRLERAAFDFAGDYRAPCQNVTDFLSDRVSERFDVAPSYPRGVVSENLRSIFPADITDALTSALGYFNGKIDGFAQGGVLTAVESRTSSPVKIVRNDAFQSNLSNLYPIGEGAGYAGGIVSSAVDGLKAAMAIVRAATE